MSLILPEQKGRSPVTLITRIAVSHQVEVYVYALSYKNRSLLKVPLAPPLPRTEAR